MTHKVYIALYLFISLVLVSGAVFAHIRILALWKDVAFRQATLQDIPAQTSQTSMINKELRAASEQMQDIRKTVVQSDGLVDIISAISAIAVDSGISAQVPQVNSNVVVVKKDAPKELFTDVRVHVVASGKPEQLASFLYRVEHLPYLLTFVSWNIDAARQISISSFENSAPADPSGAAAPLGSSLDADIVITTINK